MFLPSKSHPADCIRSVALCSFAVAALLLGACQAPPSPYVAKSLAPPPVKFCNDVVGHQAGAAPYVLGGTCCCTPSPELMSAYQASGHCSDTSLEDLRGCYERAGIQLRQSPDEYSNGLGEYGEHVVLGGKSLIPPRPGTDYLEKVTYGVGAVPNPCATPARTLSARN